nr:serine/threonine protein kinase [Deltaproteobacteria bacterium]
VEADTPFIVMERLEGETLAERLRREGTLSPPQVVSLIEQIARALTKAHAAKVVHRDLKPDNVFIVRDDDGERCKVLDFGIAKVLPGAEVAQAQTHSGMVLGTPYYMSPEQATNASDVDERADLWSMAIITYECLVGERPFDGATLPALAVKLLVDPIPVPSEHGRVPIGFDAWFGRATSRDPEQRFGSAAALARALATALEVEALSGSVMALPEPGARSHGRHWLIGMGVVLTVVLATWWVWSHRAEVPTVVDGTAAPAAGVVDVPPSTPAPVAEAEPSVAPPLAHSVDLADASPVELRLVGPAGAAVWHDTAQLGTLPDVISLPRSDTPITLRVAAVGFDDLLFEVVPNTDQQHTLQLTKVRSPAKPPRTKPPRPPGKSTVDDLEF